jgi:hypothetical protein
MFHDVPWENLSEDIQGSGSTAPPFLTLALDADEWSASCPGCFTPGERDPSQYTLNTRLGGSQSWSGWCVVEKNRLPQLGIEPQPFSLLLFWLHHLRVPNLLTAQCKPCIIQSKIFFNMQRLTLHTGRCLNRTTQHGVAEVVSISERNHTWNMRKAYPWWAECPSGKSCVKEKIWMKQVILLEYMVCWNLETSHITNASKLTRVPQNGPIIVTMHNAVWILDCIMQPHCKEHPDSYET